METERLVVKTNDGSPTVFVPALNEHYHSVHGAYTEAIHVFQKNGLELLENKSTLQIFEMGFGTGLNALVALNYAIQNNINVYYESIEKYPLNNQHFQKIKYAPFFNVSANQSLYKYEEAIQNAEWDKVVHINHLFSVKKIREDIVNFTPLPNSFNLIFFDAFGPRAQHEMWQLGVLEKMFGALLKNGYLVTYCANGQMKRNLKSLGFIVNTVKGPPGKREMTVALKTIDDLK
jgi:tRNA U34 5-methylaminomethyl-2-thiouridine-forming methyltransferase MnmC